MRRIEEYRTLLPGAQAITPSRHDRMPYRVLLGQIAERLHVTYDGRSNGYQQPAQFRADIALIAQSLLANRGAHAGLFSGAAAAVSHRYLRLSPGDAGCARARRGASRGAGAGTGRSGLDRPQRRRAARAPGRDPRARHRPDRQLRCARQAHAGGVRCHYCSAAIATATMPSGCTSSAASAQADDVLAPLVLARWAGAYDKSNGEVALDVAPQFDRVETLERCGAVIARAARGWRLQAPPGGARPAADGADRLLRQQPGERHGRLALCRLPRAAPPDRRAAQGEQAARSVLQPRRQHCRAAAAASMRCCAPRRPSRSAACCASPSRARASARTTGCGRTPCATLERAFSTLALATLAVKRGIAVRESAALAECVGLVAGHSAQAWRGLVYEQPQFLDFFRAVTPIDVIERMQIGCQPAQRSERARRRRGPARAWVLAWSQSRHMLPAWFGAGAGLEFARGRARHRAAAALLSRLAVLPQPDRRHRGDAGARRSGRCGAL